MNELNKICQNTQTDKKNSFLKKTIEMRPENDIALFNLLMEGLGEIVNEGYANTVLEETNKALIQIIKKNISNGISEIKNTLENKLNRRPSLEETFLNLIPLYTELKKKHKKSLVINFFRQEILQILKDIIVKTIPEYIMRPELLSYYQETIMNLINEEIEEIEEIEENNLQKKNDLINLKKEIETIIAPLKQKNIQEIKIEGIKKYTERYQPFFEINSAIKENENINNTSITFFEIIKNGIQLKKFNNQEIISLIQKTKEEFAEKSFSEFCQHYQEFQKDIFINDIPDEYTIQMKEIKNLSFMYLYLFYFFKYFEDYLISKEYDRQRFFNGLTVIITKENISKETADDLKKIMESIFFYNMKKFLEDQNYTALFNILIENNSIANLIENATNPKKIETWNYSDLLKIAEYEYFSSLISIDKSKILVEKIKSCLNELITKKEQEEEKKILGSSLQLIKEKVIKNKKEKSIETIIYFFKKYLFRNFKKIKKYSKIKSITVERKKLFLQILKTKTQQILKTKTQQNAIEKKLSFNHKLQFFKRWKDKKNKTNATNAIFKVTDHINIQNKGYFLKLLNEASEKKIATEILLNLNFW